MVKGITEIQLERIRLDGGTQPRSKLDEGTVSDYAARMKDEEQFPPIHVHYDGADYWPTDGFHRIEARRRAALATIRAVVTQGTREEAQWASYAANKEHDRVGLRRSHADIARAVAAALAHPNGRKMSNVHLAEHIGTSEATIRRYKREAKDANADPAAEDTTRTGRDGRTINTARIGKRRPAPDAPPAQADGRHIFTLKLPAATKTRALNAGCRTTEQLAAALEDPKKAKAFTPTDRLAIANALGLSVAGDTNPPHPDSGAIVAPEALGLAPEALPTAYIPLAARSGRTPLALEATDGTRYVVLSAVTQDGHINYTVATAVAEDLWEWEEPRATKFTPGRLKGWTLEDPEHDRWILTGEYFHCVTEYRPGPRQESEREPLTNRQKATLDAYARKRAEQAAANTETSPPTGATARFWTAYTTFAEALADVAAKRDQTETTVAQACLIHCQAVLAPTRGTPCK